MSTQIELKQEGVVRLEGYQCTQWVATDDSFTDPLSNAPLFVIRNTGGLESLERVATPDDFVAYPHNELKYFEAKNSGGSSALDALPGDLITIIPSVDFWLQADAPYADCVFEVSAIETLASGSAPVATAPNLLTVDGYAFGDADVGRWVSLVGMPGSSGVVRALVLSVLGGVATLDATLTNGTGTAWSVARLRITTDLGPSSEPRYFPTLARDLGWQITRGATVIAAGSRGATARTDPAASLFRALRVTTLEATPDAALALFEVVRAAVSALQVSLDAMGTEFLGVQTFKYPP